MDNVAMTTMMMMTTSQAKLFFILTHAQTHAQRYNCSPTFHAGQKQSCFLIQTSLRKGSHSNNKGRNGGNDDDGDDDDDEDSDLE